MANTLLVVSCCHSDQNLGQKKRLLPFLSNISKEIKATSGYFALMNIFFNRFRKEMLCNNTQLELFKK